MTSQTSKHISISLSRITNEKSHKNVSVMRIFRQARIIFSYSMRFTQLSKFFSARVCLLFKHTKSTSSLEAHVVQLKFHESNCYRGRHLSIAIHPFGPTIYIPFILAHLIESTPYNIDIINVYIREQASCFFMLFSFRGLFCSLCVYFARMDVVV